MLRSLLSTILVLLSLLSCSQKKNTGDCYFISNGEATDVCGYLSVPENRDSKNGKTIQIAYLVLKAQSRSPEKDPIVFLQGGPGGSGISLHSFWRNHPLRQNRDIVVVDQRGTGISKPSMCPDFGNRLMDLMGRDIDIKGEMEAMKTLIKSCKASLEADNVNLEAFNSKENAADIEALRQHLGYDQWNIWGGSYGSRLGLTIMRDYPEGIRSAILSGPFPPNVNMYSTLIPSFKLALDEVFSQCKNDTDCFSEYPDLEQDFYTAIKSLEDNPMMLERNDEEFWLNSQDALLLTHQLLYSRSTISDIPKLFKALKNRYNKEVQESLNTLFQRAGALSYGMYFSVQAYEELPFNNYDDYYAALENAPGFAPGLAFFGSDAQLLDQWHRSRAQTIENEAVKSDIPTLIMAGEFDPITPSWFGEKAMETLSNGQLAVFPGNGHGIFNRCANKMMKDFLLNPFEEVDKTCLGQIRPIRFD